LVVKQTSLISSSGKKEYEVDDPERISNTRGLSGSAVILIQRSMKECPYTTPSFVDIPNTIK
jgi:hypothetical protein